MDDPDGGRGEPLPTLFYGLLPKPEPIVTRAEEDREIDRPRADGAERDREALWA